MRLSIDEDATRGPRLCLVSLVKIFHQHEIAGRIVELGVREISAIRRYIEPVLRTADGEGKAAYTQLVVEARSPQLGGKDLAMQLDSGTDTAMLFSQPGLLLRYSSSSLNVVEDGVASTYASCNCRASG
jgi:hypothetical protein